MKSEKILVTGGAGFIGSSLTKRLLDEGYEVIVLDNLYTGNISTIESFKNNPKFTFLQKDVCEPLDIKVDKIFHLAFSSSPPVFKSEPIKTLLDCVNGTHNMLKLAEKNKAKILFSSNAEIYGNSEVYPQNENYRGNVNCFGERGCYDEGKRAAETLCFEYGKKGVHVRVARLFNCYGPNMNPNDGRVISKFILRSLLGKDLTVNGTGKQTRSFCFIDDTVDALIKLIDSEYDRPINVGNPEETAIIDFAQMIQELVNKEIKIVFAPGDADDPQRKQPNIEMAKTKLNWEPKTSFREGIIKTIEYFKRIIKDPNYKIETI